MVTAGAKLIIEQKPVVSKAAVAKTTQATEPIAAAAEPITAAPTIKKFGNLVFIFLEMEYKMYKIQTSF